MKTQLSRRRDDAVAAPDGSPEVDLAPLLGLWRTFNAGGSGVTAVEVLETGGQVEVRVHGSGGAPDWGAALARVFADDAGGAEAWAFRADFENEFQGVALYGYLNRGLLAVDIATSFREDDPRREYYSRTFFFRP